MSSHLSHEVGVQERSGVTWEGTWAPYLAAGLRISVGWVFLWAFMDKTFGLGRATEGKDAWIDGGSPTFGFLSFASTGPFKDFYSSIAGDAWADWLFMAGLLGIGLSFMLGIYVKLAAYAGALLLVMMWTAVLPPANNPFMDDHLIYAGLMVLLAWTHAGRTWGLGARWEGSALVQRFPILA